MVKSPAPGSKRQFASSTANGKENTPLSKKLTKWLPEDEPPRETEPSKYKWRGDPEETFSDWTIEIVITAKNHSDGPSSTENKENPPVVDTYHVHKFIMAYGSRSSIYFAKLFQMADKFKESNSSTSRIELEPITAKAFPCMLDFMYAPEKTLYIDKDKAVALHYLGDYFEIHSLRWHLSQYCQANMDLETVLLFYNDAVLLADEAILDMIAEFLGDNLLQIHPDSPLLETIQPPTWLKMLESLPTTNSKPVTCLQNSRRLCRLMVEIANNHKESMTYITFERLTHAKTMPVIDPSVALKLCELEAHFQRRQGGDYKELSSLEKRCSSALAETRSSYGLDLEEEGDEEILLQSKPAFLVDLIDRLATTRYEAEDKVDAIRHELNETKDELKEAEEELEEKSDEQYEQEAELDTAQTELEETREELEKTQQELHSLQGFIKRLRPLPDTATSREDSIALPDGICKQNPMLAKMSLTLSTQLKNQEFPVFYYDPSAVVEEESNREEETMI